MTTELNADNKESKGKGSSKHDPDGLLEGESDDSDYDPDKAEDEEKEKNPLGKNLWDDEENIIDGEEADDENEIDLSGVSITNSNNQDISGSNS